MKIFLRVLVVLLFLLSGVSLYFGNVLFQQREQLKARINALEQSAFLLSKQIEVEQAQDLEARRLPTGGVEIQDLKKYYAIDPTTQKPKKQFDARLGKNVPVTTGPGTMSAAIDRIEDNARRQTVRLDETRVTLRDTRLKYEDTVNTLSKTKGELASAYDKLDTAKDDLAAAKEDGVRLQTEIDTKNDAIAALNTQLDEEKKKGQKQEERISEQRNQIGALDKQVQDLRNELERMRMAKGPIAVVIARGRHGSVLQVNPEWQTVVMRTDPDTPLTPGITLVIRRNNTFVGKIRLVTVKKELNVAVGEIILPWLQKPIQKGDDVDYAGD